MTVISQARFAEIERWCGCHVPFPCLLPVYVCFIIRVLHRTAMVRCTNLSSPSYPSGPVRSWILNIRQAEATQALAVPPPPVPTVVSRVRFTYSPDRYWYFRYVLEDRSIMTKFGKNVFSVCTSVYRTTVTDGYDFASTASYSISHIGRVDAIGEALTNNCSSLCIVHDCGIFILVNFWSQ